MVSEMVNEEMKKVFSELIELETSNIKTTNIDNTSIFTYLFNTPKRTSELTPSTSKFHEDLDETLYIIPRGADLLLSIEITGVFSSVVELFQYDWTGSRKIIYDNSIGITGIDDKIIFNPFKQSGIPLLIIGTNIYLTIKNPNNCKITATFAYLDTKSRRELASYNNTDNKDYGVKLRHNNNNLYQVFGMCNQGHSPNYLALAFSKS
jgi:hypothetical protein